MMFQNKKKKVFKTKFLLVFCLFSLNCLAACKKSTEDIAPIAPIINVASQSLGKVNTVHQGEHGNIIIFSERHDSRLGRVQIAQMLVRLIKRGHLQVIGLEGFFPENGDLNPSWANSYESQERLDVATQLLRKGEINAGEYIALAFNNDKKNIQVKGIDDKDLYDIKLDPVSQMALFQYLYDIALIDLEKNHQELKMKQLLSNLEKSQQNKDALFSAIKKVINSDPWTQRVLAQISSGKINMQLITAIEDKAKENHIDLDAASIDDWNKFKAFYIACSQRSSRMADNSTKYLEDTSNKSIAIIVGAAHSKEITDELDKSNFSYGVITPLAIANNDKTTDLTAEQYSNKEDRHSVDQGLGFGNPFPSSHKAQHHPPPIILNDLFLKREGHLSFLTNEIVDQLLIKRKETPQTIRRKIQTEFLPKINQNGDAIIRFDQDDTVSVKGNEVIFSVKIRDDNHQWKTRWVKAWYQKTPDIKENSSNTALDKAVNQLYYETLSALPNNGHGGGKEPPNNKSSHISGEEGPERPIFETSKSKILTKMSESRPEFTNGQ